MRIENQVAVVTGGASGIGAATAQMLAARGAKIVALIDRDARVMEVANELNRDSARTVAIGRQGNVTDDAFRRAVFVELTERFGAPSICVPAAGITRDRLAVKVDRATGATSLYPLDDFRQVLEVNLIAPVAWALEMIGGLAAERTRRGAARWTPDEPIQGVAVLVGSVSSQGNAGQVSYAAAKAGLAGAAATLAAEGKFHGVRTPLVHPGFTDTPMVRALGEPLIEQQVLPATQLGRLIAPAEIADAIGFLIENDAVSGPLWADAGWRR